MSNVLCKFLLLTVMTVTLATSSLAHDNTENIPVSGNNITYTGDIKALFNDKCSGCHGDDAPEHKEFKKDKEGYKAKDLGPRMNTYTHLISFVAWPDTGAVMRRLDDGKMSQEGKQGNMYQHLGNSEQERQANLELFKKWIGIWSVKRWKATSKEEINKMVLAY